jgi:hypothetical protein
MERMEAEVRLEIIIDVHSKQYRQEGEGWETGMIGQEERWRGKIGKDKRGVAKRGQ